MSFHHQNLPLMLKRTLFDSVNFTFLAIAAYMYVSHPDESLLLDLTRNFIILTVTFGLGLAISLTLSAKKAVTVGSLLFHTPSSSNFSPTRRELRNFWVWQLALTFGAVLWLGALQTQFSLAELADKQGFHAAMNLFGGLTSPEWKLLPIAILKVIETIFIALMATVIAVPVAFLWAFASAKNIMATPGRFSIYLVLRTLLNIVRSIEPVIWAIVFSVWVGIGPFAGMLALMIQSVASLTKQYLELLEDVDDGPVEGIQSTGASLSQVVWYAMVPQVLMPYISFSIYRWDINVRMATIIGFAGGGGIGTILNQYSMRAQWPEVGCLIFVIAAVVWILDLTSVYVREALK